jgi:hypothetical protein
MARERVATQRQRVGKHVINSHASGRTIATAQPSPRYRGATSLSRTCRASQSLVEGGMFVGHCWALGWCSFHLEPGEVVPDRGRKLPWPTQNASTPQLTGRRNFKVGQALSHRLRLACPPLHVMGDGLVSDDGRGFRRWQRRWWMLWPLRC